MFARQAVLVGARATSSTTRRNHGWTRDAEVGLGGSARLSRLEHPIVVAQIAKKNRRALSFWELTKYGLVATVVTLRVATPYLLVRY